MISTSASNERDVKMKMVPPEASGNCRVWMKKQHQNKTCPETLGFEPFLQSLDDFPVDRSHWPGPSRSPRLIDVTCRRGEHESHHLGSRIRGSETEQRSLCYFSGVFLAWLDSNSIATQEPHTTHFQGALSSAYTNTHR